MVRQILFSILFIAFGVQFAHSQSSTVTVVNGGDIIYSSPAIAEIDGDEENGDEITVGAADGKLHTFRGDGSLIWSANIPIGCSISASNRVYSSPAVAVLEPGQIPTVVIGYGGLGSGACDGGLAAFRGSDGALLWNFNLRTFSKKQKFGARFRTVYSTPAIADTDGDGKMEIGFGSFDRNVYLLESTGKVRWYYNAADTVWSSPTFFDINDDGKLEMIIGTDITANKHLRPQTRNGGFLYALNTAKRKRPRIYFREKGAYKWQRYFDQVIHSSPVIADVLASNPGPEIIITAGCYFPERTNNKKGKWIKIVRPKDGRVLQTLPTTACSPSPVAVADFDGDEISEIVSLTNGSTQVGGDGKTRLSVWKAESQTPIWSVVPRDNGSTDSYGGNFQSASIGDLNGDGVLDIVISNGRSVGVYNVGVDQSLLSLETGGTLKATPALADLNGDDAPEIIIGSGEMGTSNGALFIWSDFSSLPTNSLFSTPENIYATPWSMYRGNAERTGVGY